MRTLERIAPAPFHFTPNEKDPDWINDMNRRCTDAINRHNERIAGRGFIRGACADKGARIAELPDYPTDEDKLMYRVVGFPNFVFCNFHICGDLSCIEEREDLARIRLQYIDSGEYKYTKKTPWAESFEPIIGENEEEPAYKFRLGKWKRARDFKLAVNHSRKLEIEHMRGLLENRDTRIERQAIAQQDDPLDQTADEFQPAEATA